MENKAHSRHAAFAQLAAEGADAGRIADLSVSTWRDVDEALSPVIGQRGVAALYKRSLYLTRDDQPSLAPVYEGELGPGEFGDLRAALSKQTSANAAATTGALLRTFHELLANLIGDALTDQLLRTILEKTASNSPALHNTSSSGHAVQDESP